MLDMQAAGTSYSSAFQHLAQLNNACIITTNLSKETCKSVQVVIFTIEKAINYAYGYAQ